MTPQDYDYFCKLFKARSGLTLLADKHYLVESRLLPVARRIGAQGLSALVAALKAPNAEPLITEVVEAMTTNESLFFRDKVPFEQFRDVVMPTLLTARSKSRRLRIWCAAAATGQEPYTLAITLKEMGRELRGWRIEILATDLATGVLEKAKSGVYSQFEVQRGLPVMMLIKYFSQIGDTWQIAPELRGMVQFKPFNLLHDFSRLGRFDVIFCRNVLIYFDQNTKIDVLTRMAAAIEPSGFLALGAAETVVGLTEAFKPMADRRGFYVPNGVAGSLEAAPPRDNVVQLKPRVAAG